MEKFIEYLSEAQRIIKACDHMVYVSYPLIKDKKLLIKIIVELKKAITYCINAILQYEYLFQKIKLSKDHKENLKIFTEKSSIRFGITKEETKKIIELFEIVEIHKHSPMEFSRDNKIVILTQNMNQQIVSLEKTKEFVQLTKEIFRKIRIKIKEDE